MFAFHGVIASQGLLAFHMCLLFRVCLLFMVCLYFKVCSLCTMLFAFHGVFACRGGSTHSYNYIPNGFAWCVYSLLFMVAFHR